MSICVVLGAGAYAREIYWCAKISGLYTEYVFVDDFSERKELLIDSKSFPVEKNWSFSKYQSEGIEIGFLVGVGDPKIKEKLVKKALEAGLLPLPTIVHPHAIIQDPACKIGSGGVIAPGCILTTNITIGDYVLLNVGVTIGHDVIVGDFVTCAPQVAIGGNVELHRGVNLGIGSVIREKIKVSAYTRSGAQSCIVKDLNEEGTLIAGVPAAPLRVKVS